MSSTNRGGQRSEADNYPTPAWCVHRLLEACQLPGGCWFEPACGEGAIIKAVDSVRDDVEWGFMDVRREPVERLVNEVDCEGGLVGDFTTYQFPGGWPWKVIITNPPYSLAMNFLTKAIPLAGRVAMLLRLNFLAGGGRADFMRAQEPDVYVLPNRPSFTGHGTDSCEYAWFVFGASRPKPSGIVRVLATTPKEQR
jgi:hypothetical protein